MELERRVQDSQQSALIKADSLVNKLQEQLDQAKKTAVQYQGAQQTLEQMIQAGYAVVQDDGSIRPIVRDANTGEHFV